MSNQCKHIVPEYPLFSGVVSAATFTQACEARRELMQRVSTICAASIARRAEEIPRSADTARRMGITAIELLGRDGGSVLPMCNEAVVVPTQDTAMIQEIHLMVIHLMCGAIDDAAAATELVTVSLLT